MDPPYQGVSASKDRRYIEPLDIGAFVRELRDLNRRGICYLISFDGRCGNKSYGQDLPQDLQLERKMLVAGRSTQATLLGRDDVTIESLYISPALALRLQNQGDGVHAHLPLFQASSAIG